MTRRRVVEIRLPRRTGRLLLALAGATYTHLLIAVVLLVWGTGVAGTRELPLLPTLAVSLVAAPPAPPAAEPPVKATPPAPKPEPKPKPPPPKPKPEPKTDDAVREVPDKVPEKTPEEKPTQPAPAQPTHPGPETGSAETPGPGPAEVEAPGAVSSAAGSTVGGLEGVAGVETYNQRVASILSTFVPWQRLVLPPGTPPRVLTVSFLARRQGRRARVERVAISAPSGYDAFDRAIERAVKEMAFVPLPAGEPSEFLSFRFQVVLHAAGGP